MKFSRSLDYLQVARTATPISHIRLWVSDLMVGQPVLRPVYGEHRSLFHAPALKNRPLDANHLPLDYGRDAPPIRLR